MSYYFVANYDVTDQEMYNQYTQAVPATLGEYSVKALVIDHKPNDIEGKSNSTLLILEFESEEEAMAWYNSPAYQEIVKLRTDATDGWVRGASQFVMPSS